MRRLLLLSTLALTAACHAQRAPAPPPSLSGIGAPIPITHCASTQPLAVFAPPRAILARNGTELAAEVSCVGESLAERLKVDFAAHYVLVVTFTSRSGGHGRVDRIDDDGVTLTVVANELSGGCGGSQQPTNRETVTLLVPAAERKVRIQSTPWPGPVCDPRLS